MFFKVLLSQTILKIYSFTLQFQWLNALFLRCSTWLTLNLKLYQAQQWLSLVRMVTFWVRKTHYTAMMKGSSISHYPYVNVSILAWNVHSLPLCQDSNFFYLSTKTRFHNGQIKFSAISVSTKINFKSSSCFLGQFHLLIKSFDCN